MSPELEEGVKVVALINRKNRRIELFLVKSEDIEALEADLCEYDISFGKEIPEFGVRIAILGFDKIVEVEGEE